MPAGVGLHLRLLHIAAVHMCSNSVRGHGRPRLADACSLGLRGRPPRSLPHPAALPSGPGKASRRSVDRLVLSSGGGLACLAPGVLHDRSTPLEPAPHPLLFRTPNQRAGWRGRIFDPCSADGPGKLCTGRGPIPLRGRVREPLARPPCLSSRISGGVCSGPSHRCPGYGGGGGGRPCLPGLVPHRSLPLSLSPPLLFDSGGSAEADNVLVRSHPAAIPLAPTRHRSGRWPAAPAHVVAPSSFFGPRVQHSSPSCLTLLIATHRRRSPRPLILALPIAATRPGPHRPCAPARRYFFVCCRSQQAGRGCNDRESSQPAEDATTASPP